MVNRYTIEILSLSLVTVVGYMKLIQPLLASFHPIFSTPITTGMYYSIVSSQYKAEVNLTSINFWLLLLIFLIVLFAYGYYREDELRNHQE